jgi:hypothetical protein
VTHSQSGIKYDDFILREYLVYKLYNVLTDSSYKVRLLRVNYIDTEKKRKPLIQYGIFIEPKSLLASRNHSVEVESMNLTQNHIQPEVMDRVAIFNYMVGNTDWSVPNLHNVKVLSKLKYDNSNLGMIVPYDFDYSGLVNADYAVPFEGLGLKSVLERRYVGICRSEETFIQAVQEFKDKKDEFYRVINEFPLLKERTKKEMIGYLDSFFKGFDNRYSVVQNILSGCSNF